ncbi:hypothetical protein BGX38DRAFT_1219389, partial [Terfezia claveryi]
NCVITFALALYLLANRETILVVLSRSCLFESMVRLVKETASWRSLPVEEFAQSGRTVWSHVAQSGRTVWLHSSVTFWSFFWFQANSKSTVWRI